VLVVNILAASSASKDADWQAQGHAVKVSNGHAPPARRPTHGAFSVPPFGVAVSAIEVVFGRENVNKQLRITVQVPPTVFLQLFPPQTTKCNWY
jgi:hypothetical protein